MDSINLQISDELKEKILKKIKETNFKTLEEYITYVLEQVTADTTSSEDAQPYTQDEEAAVKKRLEELGYL